MMRAPLLFVALLALAACATKPPAPKEERLVLTRTDYAALPGWPADRHGEVLQSFLASCRAIEKKGDDKEHGQGLLKDSVMAWKAPCAEARGLTSEVVLNAVTPQGETIVPAPIIDVEPDDATARSFFERNFTPYAASNNGTREGLFTGYYEPLLYGSRTKQAQYQTPVYAVPPDLVKGQSYFSRREIEQGALAGKGLELAYVDRPIDLFFLQIQGSGRLQFDTGEQMRLAYAGQNGHAYVALGKVMKERGLLPPDGISMFAIKAWLADHPAEAAALMWENPSYVFFALEPADGVTGPKGAQGVPLTPERSLAVDKGRFAYGLPVYLETTLPFPEATPYARTLIAQDTGGAIKGPVRGDVFFGHGERAETLAGYMKQRGQWTLLVPNAVAARLGTRAE